MDILDAVKEVGCSLKNTGTDSREGEMPCYKKDRVLELEGVVDVVVVDDDCRTKRDPDGDDGGCRGLGLGFGLDGRDGCGERRLSALRFRFGNNGELFLV